MWKIHVSARCSPELVSELARGSCRRCLIVSSPTRSQQSSRAVAWHVHRNTRSLWALREQRLSLRCFRLRFSAVDTRTFSLQRYPRAPGRYECSDSRGAALGSSPSTGEDPVVNVCDRDAAGQTECRTRRQKLTRRQVGTRNMEYPPRQCLGAVAFVAKPSGSDLWPL